MLDEKSVMAIKLHLKLLAESRPRELKPFASDCWFVQTDAHYEPDVEAPTAGIGGVLFRPDGTPVRFFSKETLAALIDVLNPRKKKNIIFECEFLAVFCAFWIWAKELHGAAAIYTDNNGVRDSLIACNTSGDVGKKILLAVLALETENQLTPWYSRVPTDSNTADAPSRFEVRKLLAMNCSQDNVELQACWDAVLTLSGKQGE